MVANKLLTELGGQNLSERTDKTALSEDMEETLRTIVNIGSKGMAQMPYNILQDNGSFTNQDYLFADRFTDSTGANDTVTTASTTATFDTNKYSSRTLGTVETSTYAANNANDVTTATLYANSSCINAGFISQINFKTGLNTGTNGNFRFTVRKNGTGIATNTISVGANTSYTINLTQADYSAMISPGDTWDIYFERLTGDRRIQYTSGTAYNGTNFSVLNTSNRVSNLDTSSNELKWTPVTSSGVVVCNQANTRTLDGTESTLSLFGKVTPFIYTGTGDGNNDDQNFSPVAGYTSAQTEGGVKIIPKNDVLLTKVKLPVYDSAYTGGVVKIYDSTKTLLKTISTTNTVTSGTADGADDTHTLSGTWGSGGSPSTLNGIRVNAVNSCFVKSVTKEASCTATKAYVIRNNRIIATATFSGNTATFSPYPFLEKGGVYSVLCGSDGSSHTARQATTPTYTMSADLSQSTEYGNSRGIATYVNATTTSGDNAGTGDNNIMNITSIVTQTASADSTRYVDSGIDYLLKAGRYYYIQESVTAYTNNYVPNFTQTFPDNTPADIKLTGGSYSTSVTDSTAYNFGILGLVTQNLTGAATKITNITADISDGTTTISAQPIDGTPIDISTLGVGALKLTFNLTSTDASYKAELFGFGGYIQ